MKTREAFDQYGKLDTFKVRVLRRLSRYEQLLRFLKLGMRILRFVLWRFRIFFRKRQNDLDFDQIFWVNPDDVVYCTLKEFNPFKYDGLVLDGEWDRKLKKFNELDVVVSFREHFFDKIDWHHTQFYKNTVAAINRKIPYWGCESEHDFYERCRKLDDLFENIKNNGYKTQENLQRGFLGINKIDEISINIGRNGDLLFNDGAHRLSIAKLLKLDKVPIRVTVCHKTCCNFSKIGMVQ